MSAIRPLLLLTLAAALLLACGGTTGTGNGNSSSTGQDAGDPETGAGGAASCEAYPACDSGDRALDGPCPPAYSCYERSLCGTTIWCLELLPDGGPAPLGGGTDGGACNPGAEHHRHYVATSPDRCALIDFMCPENTRGFSNGCGCGCEQDPSCPESVDCMPGPAPPDPLCGAAGQAKCPYTLRAL